MHEASIAQSIIEIAEKHLAEGGYRRATRIAVRVGYLSAVVPESLDFAFKALSRGTALADAELEVEEVAAEGRCRACSARFPVDSFYATCEACGSCDVEIMGGDDLTVESMEVER